MENNNDIQLIKIEAVVREEMFVDVKKALTDIGVNGITAYQVVGCGIQRGMSEYVRGQKVDVQVLPKIKFEIVVSSEEWERKTIEAIRKTAFTGNPGDGKIFTYYLKQAVKTDIFLFSYIKKVRTEFRYALFACKIVYLLIVISSGLTVLSRSLL